MDDDEPRKCNTSLDALIELDRVEAHEAKVGIPENASDPNAGKWARAEIHAWRASALATKSIYGYCFVGGVQGSETLYGWSMIFIAMVIQVVIPACIIGTREPIQDVDPEGYWGGKTCPNKSAGMIKFLGLTLCIFYVTLVVSLCTNKLRGLGFLRTFVWLGRWRRMFLDLGIFAQIAGMSVAAGAQFLLFVGNGGRESLVLLLLQSIAMQFCLTVDQKLVSDQIGSYTNTRIVALSEGSLLCKGLGVGKEEGAVPEEAFRMLCFLVNAETIFIRLLVVVGLIWASVVAFCM